MQNIKAHRFKASTISRASPRCLTSRGCSKTSKPLQQAAVKAQVAMELGVSPMLGLSAIHIVEGRPTLSAGMLASLMKRAGYSRRIWECVAEEERRRKIRGEEGCKRCPFGERVID